MTPEDFTIEVTHDGIVTIECPHPHCWWDFEIGRFDTRNETLRWVLAAASDHLDDKEANHG